MPDRKFAAGTAIDSGQTEIETRKILKKYGATKYAYYEDQALVGFVFEYENRRVRNLFELPDHAADEFVFTTGGNRLLRKERSKESQLKFWQSECNRRWRALLFVVKSKLITVSEGIRTFAQEFLYDIVLPNNQTVGEYVGPQINQSYLNGKMPPMLPGIRETK